MAFIITNTSTVIDNSTIPATQHNSNQVQTLVPSTIPPKIVCTTIVVNKCCRCKCNRCDKQPYKQCCRYGFCTDKVNAKPCASQNSQKHNPQCRPCERKNKPCKCACKKCCRCSKVYHKCTQWTPPTPNTPVSN